MFSYFPSRHILDRRSNSSSSSSGGNGRHTNGNGDRATTSSTLCGSSVSGNRIVYLDNLECLAPTRTLFMWCHCAQASLNSDGCRRHNFVAYRKHSSKLFKQFLFPLWASWKPFLVQLPALFLIFLSIVSIIYFYSIVVIHINILYVSCATMTRDKNARS